MNDTHIKALHLAKQGEWEQSHDLIQDGSDSLSCLIHGYLHRVEGDISNAKYWYQRANTHMPDNTLSAELERLYQLAENTNN